LFFLAISLLTVTTFAGCSFSGSKTEKTSLNSDEDKTIGGKTGDKTTNDKSISMSDTTKTDASNFKTAVLAGGCFWCIETIFQDIKGVEKVESGYSGGSTKNPSYKEVCSGTTGHAEVIKITYDPAQISYEQLLTVFFHIHNPTTMNKQGADVGTQYRSAIFYSTDEEKASADKVIADITASKLWDDPIVTEVTKLGDYYKAEDYHQDYYNNNMEQSYCSYVIAPKVRKFYNEFPQLLKDNVKQ
jgi:peptide-methionine (S)-S-oxide reductase